MARRGRVDDAVRRLQEVLPQDWSASVARRGSGGREIRITPPSGSGTDVDIVAVAGATPRSVGALAPVDRPTLVAADWLSERAQTLLRERGFSFIDATGNAEIQLSEPGLYIRTEGAKRNPTPVTLKGPTLRGPKAWALLRTLAEVRRPIGVRELAKSVDVDAGYVSRVLGVLEQELLVTRTPRGPVTDVEWEGVLRRAASTYSLFDSNKTSTWVASSGPERLLADLAGKRAGRWRSRAPLPLPDSLQLPLPRWQSSTPTIPIVSRAPAGCFQRPAVPTSSWPNRLTRSCSSARLVLALRKTSQPHR